MKLRAALIGCGRIGSEFADDPNRDKIGIYSHAEAYAVSKRANLVAVCDQDPERAQRCGARWGVGGIFSEVSQLLAEAKPEIVSISTPDPVHFEQGMAAVTTASVRGVLMEKPLSLDLGEASELVRAAAANDVHLAVNYSRRHAESFIALRDFIAGGGIGEIQSVHGYYTKGLIHNGTHWIDLLRFLAGEISGAKAMVDLEGVDPTPDVAFTLKSGASACLQGLDHRSFTLFEMDLMGSNGRVQVVDSGHRFVFSKAQPSDYYAGYTMLACAPLPFEGGMRDVTANAIENLIDSMQGLAALRCSGDDALHALRWALAMSA